MKQSFLDKEYFKDIFCVRAFWDYIKFFLKVSIGEYMDYAGWEMKTIICGVYGDVNIIAAWAAIQALMAVNYTYGQGFSNSMRTYVGRNIGEQEFGAAKRFAGWAMLLCACFVIPLFIIVGIFYHEISYFFTAVPATLAPVSTNILIYSIVGPLDC
jgi:Na+-driven multidrug efflux pump